MRSRVVTSLAFFLAACNGGASRPSSDLPVALTATPVLDLTLGTDDSVLIGRLNHAIRLPDNRIVAVDGDAMALAFLDSTGAMLQRVGREGAGPGEFQFPSWVGRCHSDSLFVWDAQLQRMSVFSATGSYAREFRVPLTRPFMFRCSPAGTIAAFADPPQAGGPPVPGAEYPVLRSRMLLFGIEGDSIGGVVDIPIGQERPLGALAAMAISDSQLFLGLNSSAALIVHSHGGREMVRESLSVAPRPPTDAEYHAELDRLAARMGGSAEMRARVRAMLAVAPKPEVLPLYRVLLLSGDRDATRWVVTSLEADSVTRLLGHSPTGRTYTLTLPGGIELFEIGADFLLGRLSDPDRGDRLLMYRFDRLAP